MNLELIGELTPRRFREVGAPERLFVCERTGRVLVVSRTSRLYWPGRTLYDVRPAYRCSLYEPGPDGLTLFTSYDHAGLEVNEAAFHPSEPVIALATGAYDGGYMWEGELLRWNLETGAAESLLDEQRCVTRVRFEADGTLHALLTARDDGEIAQHERAGEGDPYFGARVTGDDVTSVPGVDTPVHPSRLGFGSPWATRTGLDVAAYDAAFEERSALWDVAWLDDAAIAIAHDAARLEVFRLDGERLAHHAGPGRGVELVPPAGDRPAMVNVWTPPAVPDWEERGHNELFAIEDGGARLRSVHTERGTFSVSGSADGSLLLRRFFPYRAKKRLARVLGPDLGLVRELELGEYDVFNHSLKATGGDALLALAGPYDDKSLLALRPDGEEVARVRVDTGERNGMNPTGAGARDRLALALVQRPADVFARPTTDVTLRDPATLAVRAAVTLPGRVTALAWALDGACLCASVTNAPTGDSLTLLDGDVRVVDRVPLDAFDLASSPTCLAARDERLAVGTNDGRLLLYRVRA